MRTDSPLLLIAVVMSAFLLMVGITLSYLTPWITTHIATVAR